jgi:hypothetical protein
MNFSTKALKIYVERLSQLGRIFSAYSVNTDWILVPTQPTSPPHSLNIKKSEVPDFQHPTGLFDTKQVEHIS